MSPSRVREQAQLFATLQAKQARSAALTARIGTYASIVGKLFDALQVLETATNGLKMLAEGTILGYVERQVRQVQSQADEARTWAEDTVDGLSLLTATAQVSSAISRNDEQGLLDVSSRLGDVGDALAAVQQQFQGFHVELAGRAAALKIASEYYGKLVGIVQGSSTMPNANELAMHISLQRLSGLIGSAANTYGEAADHLYVPASTSRISRTRPVRKRGTSSTSTGPCAPGGESSARSRGEGETPGGFATGDSGKRRHGHGGRRIVTGRIEQIVEGARVDAGRTPGTRACSAGDPLSGRPWQGSRWVASP